MQHVQSTRGEHTALPRASIGNAGRNSAQARAVWPEAHDAPHPRAIAMADAMRETAASAGGATVADLIGRGFTMAEITEHEPAARRMADAAIVREVTPPGDRVPDIIQKAIDSIASRMPMTSGLEPDDARLAKMTKAWGVFCAGRAAFKLDPWVSQSERCVHMLNSFLYNLPLLPREVSRITYALAAEQKIAMSRRAARHG